MEESTAYQSQETSEVSAETQEMTYTESLAAQREGSANQADTEPVSDDADTSKAIEGSDNEGTNATEEVAPAPIKVKYNHEEKEIPYEEATTLIQKGLNHDKVAQRLAERDAEVARRFGAQGITTWEQLVAGWDKTQQIQQVQMLDQQYLAAADKIAEQYGADPAALREIAQELANSHPAVQRLNQLEQENGQIKTQAQIQEQINREATAFKQAYPDLDYSTIPQEVWDRCNNGMKLMDSYQIHENALLREKIAKLEKATQVKEQNKKNATSSPGSVTGNGATVADHISQETFEQNRGNSEWVNKNLTKITTSKWYTDKYGKPNR